MGGTASYAQERHVALLIRPVQWGSGELLAKQQRSGQVRFGPIHTVMPPCTVVFGLQTLAAVSIASRLSALSVRS